METRNNNTEVDLVAFRKRLETMIDDSQNTQPKVQLERAFVKETILRAYEFQRAVNTLKELINDERIINDPVLSSMFQAEIDQKEPITTAILSLPTNLLSYFEINLIKLVKYQLEHKAKEIEYIPVPDKEFCKWLSAQRLRINAFRENRKSKKGSSLQVIQQDISLLERLNVKWRVIPTHKVYEDYLIELKEFKEKYGHIKVKQKQDGTNLGEWIKKLRKEYDMLLLGEKVPTLTPERMTELDEMGMIWKIRHGRPKKGDPRFRLRRRSDGSAIHLRPIKRMNLLGINNNDENNMNNDDNENIDDNNMSTDNVDGIEGIIGNGDRNDISNYDEYDDDEEDEDEEEVELNHSDVIVDINAGSEEFNGTTEV